MQFAVLLIRR